MELSKQVCSLELSKQLKNLGFEQDSLWWWYKGELYRDVPDYQEKQLYSAYTVAELGEELKKVGGTKILRAYRECGGSDYHNVAENMLNILDVNFLAKMLIYLKENNLIN